MIHHGQNLAQIARQKGFNKSQIAKILEKKPQAVDYDFRKQTLNIETLKQYSSVFNIPLEQLQTTQRVEDLQINYKDKYFDLLERFNGVLTTVIQSGIKVDFGGLGKLFEYRLAG